MFENVDGRTDDGRTDGRTPDAGVTGILIAHLGAFGSGELKIHTLKNRMHSIRMVTTRENPTLVHVNNKSTRLSS